MNEQLLKKVAALAISGIDGEKENAIRILEKLGLKAEDIIEPEKRYEIPYNTKNEWLIAQVIFAVLGDEWTKKTGIFSNKKSYSVLCNPLQYSKIEEKITVLKELLVKEERKLNAEIKKMRANFKSAFANKHNLFPDESAWEGKKMSPEEIQELHRWMARMEDSNIVKRIGEQ